MLKSNLITLVAVYFLMAACALAGKYPVNDNSTNNTCKYVHNWFLHAKVKHAAFATTGGVPYGRAAGKVTCQAGGGGSLSEAKAYAIKGCERINKRVGLRGRCKVVESR